MALKIVADTVPSVPWQDRPDGSSEILWRYTNNPITDWNPFPGGARVFNSAAVPFGDGFIGVFRADSTRTNPSLHVGRSNDGITWEFDPEPLEFGDFECPRYDQPYDYDPRVVRIGDMYYIIWCTWYHGPTLALARTRDFETFTRMENAFLPFNRNGVLFPRKINDCYAMLNRPSDNGHTPFGDIFLSYSPDLVHWGRHRHVMTGGSENWWENVKIGPGPAPIETSEGWLLFYHGVSGTCNGFVYSIGAALLDLDDPSRVLHRTPHYLFTPEKPYETTGFVPNVTFPCAAITDGATGRIALYYGAADTYTALAFCHAEEMVGHLIERK